MKHPDPPSSPICIAGMHRSGTSMVSRLLNLTGLDLGPENSMLPPLPHNPAGFWEHLGFLQLNEEILRQLGAGWDYIPHHLPNKWAFDARFDSLKASAKKIAAGFAPSGIWGWKDPRNSLTIPFWKTVFPDLKVVICMRNPMEVAMSLAKRNGNSIMLGLHLWYVYNRRLLDSTTPENRLVTHYEAYFADPESELERIWRWIGNHPQPQQITEACQSIAGGLRNNRIPFEQTQGVLARDLMALYLCMAREAGWIPRQWIDARYEHALRLAQEGCCEAAIAEFEGLLEIFPAHASANNDLGVLYHQQGDWERAQTYFESAIQNDPGNLLAMKNLADLWVGWGRMEEALSLFEKMLIIAPHDTETLSHLGDLLEAMGRMEDARYFKEKACTAHGSGGVMSR